MAGKLSAFIAAGSPRSQHCGVITTPSGHRPAQPVERALVLEQRARSALP